MDKKQNDKMLEIIRAMQANGGMMEDPSMPEHIKELIRNAQDSGANVLAVSAEQYAAMGGDVTDLLENSMMLSVSANRDTKDPRYALSNQFAKELASREMELMQIMKGKGAPAHDVIRLQALMFGNIDEMMAHGKRVMEEKPAGKDKIEMEVLSTLAMMKTIGISNLFDAMKAGVSRLRWHGVPSRSLSLLGSMADNIPRTIASRLELPLSAVSVIVDEMSEPEPLAPLPPEKVFDPDLNGLFMRSLLPEANRALDVLISKGFKSLADIFALTDGLPDLEEKHGLDAADIIAFSMILERIDSVSIEAIDAVVAMLPENEEEEAARLREAELQPVVPLTDPVVIAALGINLITSLEIAGVVDLHEMSGLRPTEAGTMMRNSLDDRAHRAIKDVLRFKNELCPCEACAGFKKAYVELNPAVKLALRTPPHKPTLH